MPRTCTACRLPKRKAAFVARSLASGVPLRDIARRAGLTKDIIAGHRKHVAPAVSKAIEKRQEAEAIGTVQALSRIAAGQQRRTELLDGRSDYKSAAVVAASEANLHLAVMNLKASSKPQVQQVKVSFSFLHSARPQARLERLDLEDATAPALEPAPPAAGTTIDAEPVASEPEVVAPEAARPAPIDGNGPRPDDHVSVGSGPRRWTF